MLTWFLMGGVCGALALPNGYPFATPPPELVEVERAMKESSVRLSQLEEKPGWRHFPHAILVAAVQPGRRALAVRLGDWLVREEQAGAFRQRQDWHRDTYMWLEAYRLLRAHLTPAQGQAWRTALRAQIAELAQEIERSKNAARYTGQFLHTSPNHFALYAATVHLGGLVFVEARWRTPAAQVLSRFAREQHPDGFWGEQSADAPTIGYSALTLTAVGLYYEHSRDPAAKLALERATRFHAAFTYADGQPNELMNDRNRHWFVSPWGHFAFSHFAAGRRLVRRFRAMDSTLETLGRRAQNALYWHDGPEQAPLPWQGRLPVTVQRQGPWTVTLSGLTGAAPAHSRWFLDRQSHVSVHHERVGLIVSGAPSKGQPELAQFGSAVALDGARRGDEIALAYPGFTARLQARVDGAAEVAWRLTPHGPRPPGQVRVAIQLALHAGETIESANGQRARLTGDRLEWHDLGGWIRHHGWTIHLPAGAVLTWSQFGYNPYRAGPDDALQYAVGLVAWQEPLEEGRASPAALRITVP